MKTTYLFITVLIMFAWNIKGVAQVASSSQDSKCSQLQTVLDDADYYFDEYVGDFIDEDAYYAYYDYNFNLWNSEDSEYFLDEYGDGWVEFYFNSTYDLEEAKAFFNSMVQQVKNCMPENYFLSSTYSEYSLVYNEFMDIRDKDDTDMPIYPTIEVSVEDQDDYYYVMITIYSPFWEY